MHHDLFTFPRTLRLTQNFTWRACALLSETPEHDTYHCELSEAFGDEGKRFVVGHQTSIASEPGQRPFESPITYARMPCHLPDQIASLTLVPNAYQWFAFETEGN